MREIKVEESYAGKSVLISGATGFVGKVVTEKLLRDCDGIEKIFILLRGKKGDGIEKRFEIFKNNEIFNLLKSTKPNAMDKLCAIEGDLLADKLGISAESEEMIVKNVNVIIHCAATVKFDEPVKIALKMNTISTRDMLNLAEKCENFNAFVHVSTAYSNTDQKVVYEKIYEPKCDYKHVISLVEQKKDEELLEVETNALKTFPNTYVFTKNLTEKLVSDYVHLPITIVRPSIVCPSVKEPYVGWVDSIYGPMGILMGAGAGVLRTIHGDGDIVSDLIPCDFVSNCIIAAGASVISSETKSFEIYNCTSSSKIPVTWNQFIQLGLELYPKYPQNRVLWYPGGRMCANYYFYLFYFTIFQFIPAILLDGLAVLAGQKTWAIKLQRKIFDSTKLFSFFICNQWEWRSKNFELLFKMLKQEEKEKFNFDVASIDLRDYVEGCIIGSRKFILKLDDSSLPDAKRKLNILFWIDFIVKIICYAGFSYMFYNVYTKLFMRPLSTSL